MISSFRPRRTQVLLASTAAAALALSGLTLAVANADVVQHITNGTLDTGTDPWWSTENAPLRVADGRLCADVPAGTANPWDVSLGHNGIPLANGDPYTLAFSATASAPVTVRANVQLNEAPYTTVLSRELALAASPQEFTYDFTGSLDSPNGTFTFQLGGSSQAFTFCLDDVVLSSDSDATPPTGGAEQLENGTFDNGLTAWYTYGTGAPTVSNGRVCAVIPGGLANPWDAGIGQNGVKLVAGEEYKLMVEASANPPTALRTSVQLGAEPYTGYFSTDVPLTAEVTTHEYTFVASADTEQAQVAFQVGGSATEWTLCLETVSLRGGEEEPPYTPDTGPRVRVNQVGYLPKGPKNATIVTDAAAALPWELKNSAGTTVASGQSTPRGLDAASGQKVHSVDFGAYVTAGTGYTLAADGEVSHPFDISADVYDRLRQDSLQFFYAQRSGIAIDGGLIGSEYARPAGHLGVAPNKGDTDVPCVAGVCDYRLDVRGGWYDAGDHGKYVVNGGIAAYQLLSTFERTKGAVTGGFGSNLGDGSLRVPEHGNATPDILDEARWELDFLMRMQVPAGKPKAGMAHHKMHDKNWTGIPMLPQNDPEQRELHAVSTAATLNLAATAAQCGRLYAPYDAPFAARCLASARAAYTAAKANPAVYADPNDGNGGGTYSDNDVSDEFYWAAAELYLTTGEAAYLTDLSASPHHTGNVFSTQGFGWGSTAALGRLDLATVPSGLSTAEQTRIRQSVVTAANGFLATLAAEAYGLPMAGARGNYFWGGNSNILNNVVVLATAYDLSNDRKYLDGALQGVDYLFGRNALNHSYVTGWGEVSSQNQHSRIFAHQADQSLPHPPAGSLAGGANAGLDDPYAGALLAGCAPMFCYVDHIESYATNEVAVNWNSALGWVASFLADQNDGSAPAPAKCTVKWTNYGTWAEGGGFTGQIDVTNTGTTAINGWSVKFAFPGDQKIREAWLGKASQSGATVTLTNESYNARIQPGASVMVGFNAVTTAAKTPPPALITVNGSRCG